MDNIKHTVARIDPKAAYDYLQKNDNAVLIDVRTNMEYLFVGHPIGSLHIPWQEEPDWRINPYFVDDVGKALIGRVGDDIDIRTLPLLLICRSGKRSFDAGQTLIDADFRSVFNVEEGFEGDLDMQNHRSQKNGWRHYGLPWEQC